MCSGQCDDATVGAWHVCSTRSCVVKMSRFSFLTRQLQRAVTHVKGGSQDPNVQGPLHRSLGGTAEVTTRGDLSLGSSPRQSLVLPSGPGSVLAGGPCRPRTRLSLGARPRSSSMGEALVRSLSAPGRGLTRGFSDPGKGLGWIRSLLSLLKGRATCRFVPEVAGGLATSGSRFHAQAARTPCEGAEA